MEALAPLLSAQPLVLALVAIVLLVWRIARKPPSGGDGSLSARLEKLSLAMDEVRRGVEGHERQFTEYRGLGTRMAAVDSTLSAVSATLTLIQSDLRMIIDHLLEQRRRGT